MPVLPILQADGTLSPDRAKAELLAIMHFPTNEELRERYKGPAA